MKAANSKSVQYLGGALKRIFRKLKNRDTSDVYQLIAFVIVLADMYSDPEAREGISVLAGMINSTDDFMDLLDYFALADDEIVYKPEEDTAFLFQNSPLQQFAGAEWGLFPQAYARTKPEIGRALGKALTRIAPDIEAMKGKAPKTLGEIGRNINKSESKSLKEVAFEEGFVKGGLKYAKRVGVSQIGKLLTSKHRMGPITLIAIIVYLEEELDSGRLFRDLSKYDSDHNTSELRKLYAYSIPAVVAGDKNYGNFVYKAHGAQFQLMQIAILHALDVAGFENSKVVGIEVPRLISIFEKKDDLKEARDTREFVKRKSLEFVREVDIMTGGIGSDEIWNEVKSYKSSGKEKTGRSISISAWTWGQKSKEKDEDNDQKATGSIPHRQYILDRVADKTFARMLEEERDEKDIDDDVFSVTVKDIYWHFHKFETNTSQNPGLNNIQSAFNKLPNKKPEFYTDHVSKYTSDTFIMGSADLFLTHSKSSLKDAVEKELKEKLSLDEQVEDQ